MFNDRPWAKIVKRAKEMSWDELRMGAGQEVAKRSDLVFQLKAPVLAADNGTRPQGTELWQPGNVEGLARLMIDVLQRRADFVARIANVALENNTEKLANDIATLCLIGEKIGRQSVTLSNKRTQQDQQSDVTRAQAERTAVEQ